MYLLPSPIRLRSFTSRKGYRFMIPTKKNIIDFLPLPLLGISAFFFSQVWNPMSALAVVYSIGERPFVYRALLPWLARSLTWAGLSPSGALALLLIGFSLGLFFVMRALIDRPGAGLLSFLFCETALLLLIRDIKVYDIPTIFFFALSLLLLERGKLSAFYLLFPFATLNRETSFLLSLFFAARFFNILPWRRYIVGMGYQMGVWIGIRFALERIFADRPGSNMLFRPVEVAQGYLSKPIVSLFLLACLGLLLWMVVRGWGEKPAGIRLAFVLFFPVLLGLHLIAGYAFELRVLAEVSPVVFLLGIHSPRLKALPDSYTTELETI